MKPYATVAQLLNLLPNEDEEAVNVAQLLERATEDVDTLTLHRISARGMDALTPAQRERVSSVTAQLAAWRYHYQDAVETPFTSYAINGVSMSVDTKQLVTVGGVTVPKRLYSLLCDTGLCYRGLA